jgi:hypothetical protein
MANDRFKDAISTTGKLATGMVTVSFVLMDLPSPCVLKTNHLCRTGTKNSALSILDG